MTIEIRDITEKDRTFRGRHVPGRVFKGQHADIVPGESIRLFGLDDNRYEPKPHDITFKVGDPCITGSYNLIYMGKILKITAKTVTVQDNCETRSKRLDIAEFNRRNCHFDADKIARHNADTMMSI